MSQGGCFARVPPRFWRAPDTSERTVRARLLCQGRAKIGAPVTLAVSGQRRAVRERERERERAWVPSVARSQRSRCCSRRSAVRHHLLRAPVSVRAQCSTRPGCARPRSHRSCCRTALSWSQTSAMELCQSHKIWAGSCPCPWHTTLSISCVHSSSCCARSPWPSQLGGVATLDRSTGAFGALGAVLERGCCGFVARKSPFAGDVAVHQGGDHYGAPACLS